MMQILKGLEASEATSPVTFPEGHLLQADDSEPNSIPGKPLSEIIIEERR
jgi:hypothetical protein